MKNGEPVRNFLCKCPSGDFSNRLSRLALAWALGLEPVDSILIPYGRSTGSQAALVNH